MHPLGDARQIFQGTASSRGWAGLLLLVALAVGLLTVS